MGEMNFRAMVVRETDDGFVRGIEERSMDDLPTGELLVQVHFSSLNYKDALSASGNKGVTREYPHTPGIDAVGKVVRDASGKFSEGDEVIVTSYDLGMNTDGGFAGFIRVPADWAVALPDGLDMAQSMILGTAGFTAAQSVDALTRSVRPEDGEVLVTGATGGVGSIAVAILSKLGYRVVALTGKESAGDYLRSLGAADILMRDEYLEGSDRPMLKPRWAGVIDCVGGKVLEADVKSVQPLGVVTCCGNVASAEINLTVYPFILRGVTLVGIDSQNCPMETRQRLWQLLATDWKPDSLDTVVNRIGLDGLDAAIDDILKGRLKGRTLVDLEA